MKLTNGLTPGVCETLEGVFGCDTVSVFLVKKSEGVVKFTTSSGSGVNTFTPNLQSLVHITHLCTTSLGSKPLFTYSSAVFSRITANLYVMIQDKHLLSID